MNDLDQTLLNEVDDLLERGKPAANPLLNTLASMAPQADRDFQKRLEKMLMTELRASKEKKTMTAVTRVNFYARMPRLSSVWAVSIVMLILLAGVLFMLNDSQRPMAVSPVEQIQDAMQLVIASQDIAAGTIIDGEMLATLTLSTVEVEQLHLDSVDRELFLNVDAVIGQTAAADILWFQPIERRLFDTEDCSGGSCVQMPAGYYEIRLPVSPNTVEGLKAGNRVDVLAVAGGRLNVIVENVLLAHIEDEAIVLAAPSWQHSILVWLYHTNEVYALRLYTGEPVPAPDQTPVEYVFTAPVAIPDDYDFELVVLLPVGSGYQLTGLPASIDALDYNENVGTMNFWFKDLELVRVEDGTIVTIRLPADDAANLDYLLALGATLSFVPR